MKTNRHSQSPTARRAAFTLIELLMVVVIISLLIGLLLPAINSVVISAREARVTTEIQQLATAMHDFKAKFGFEPPSRIVLFEDGGQWMANTADARASRATLRKMFSQIAFDIDRNFNLRNGIELDPDGDNAPGVTLTGAECLVFFLGGVRSSTGEIIGFSKNPVNPLDPNSAGTGNRLGPFYPELNSGRLVDIDDDGMPEFLDPLPNQTLPYIYASSNGGRGYHTADLIVDGRQNPPAVRMLNVYRQGAAPTATPFNRQSFQIISPGYDADYGTGGYFDPDNPDASLATPTGRDAEAERDNLTNFHGGRLAP
ncbi:MAG: prepilin-type N-terminal cleavage/methylation domain-containing protein [Planctomycetes bacterium]|nr:prepilin-type N-terminal cleavage/methylation domain-containing protein [Planctomycetota bacterium]